MFIPEAPPVFIAGEPAAPDALDVGTNDGPGVGDGLGPGFEGSAGEDGVAEPGAGIVGSDDPLGAPLGAVSVAEGFVDVAASLASFSEQATMSAVPAANRHPNKKADCHDKKRGAAEEARKAMPLDTLGAVRGKQKTLAADP